jgi:hypothetical protein
MLYSNANKHRRQVSRAGYLFREGFVVKSTLPLFFIPDTGKAGRQKGI